MIDSMDWIIDNKEWVFSGIGVFILGFLLNFLRKKNAPNISQSQKIGRVKSKKSSIKISQNQN